MEDEGRHPGICKICRNPGDITDWSPFCEFCERKFPPALLKAACDPFDYALRLITGEIIPFHYAKVHGEYATLFTAINKQGDDHDFGDNWHNTRNPFPFKGARGVDVRVDAIVWVMDAPNGS